MYLRYFGLNEAPFSITPDPAFVFLSPRHRDALAHLLYGIGKGGSGGFVQLTGEVGTGKTTLCRCLLEQVPEDTHIALLLNPLVTPRELLAAISEELEIDVSASIESTRLLVDGLNRYLLETHARGERVVVIIDEAQNLSPEALEQVRLLTNLETSKHKLLQIVLLGQPELRELLQRRNLRQLAQRITARYHLRPLGQKDTHLYVQHRMRIAGAQRDPFRRSAKQALYQRSQGIPRLINIIADRALIAAFAKERTDVTAAMVHMAANEVQLGERQVRRLRWPWLVGAVAALLLCLLIVFQLSDTRFLAGNTETVAGNGSAQPATGENGSKPVAEVPVFTGSDAQLRRVNSAVSLDSAWLQGHQFEVWQGVARLWQDTGKGNAIQAACNGDRSRGYACLRDQGSWSKIERLGLPVVLVLQDQSRSFLLLLGEDKERLLVGVPGRSITVSKDSVESLWLGSYLAVWPQASEWPLVVERGDRGPAMETVMEMAMRVDVPYHGDQVFDETFELWVRGFQERNGLEADGIIGRKTLLYLMKSSINEPKLLQTWE